MSQGRLLIAIALLLAVLGPLGARIPQAWAAPVPLSLPLRIDTRMSLREQFGYEPGYELNVPSFDPGNRPFIRSRTAAQHPTATCTRLPAKAG